MSLFKKGVKYAKGVMKETKRQAIRFPKTSVGVASGLGGLVVGYGVGRRKQIKREQDIFRVGYTMGRRRY